MPQILLGAFILCFLLINKSNPFASLFRFKGQAKYIILSLIVFIVYKLFYLLLPHDLLILNINILGQLNNLLLYSIVAFVEEAYFRGLLYSNLKIKPYLKYIIITLLFTSAHIIPDLNTFICIFLIGTTLYLITDLTKNLWPAIILHLLINLSSTNPLLIIQSTSPHMQTIATFCTLVTLITLSQIIKHKKIKKA